MAFPTTPVRDQFTGTNGTDLQVYSANWQSPVAGVTALEIQSNAATGTVAGGVNWQTWGTAYGPDEEAYVTVSTAPAAGQYVGLFIRVVNESSASTTDGYFLRYLDGTFAFFRVDNGAQTAVGAGISQTMSSGDSFGIESVGSTHTIYYKASGGAWTSLGTRSDSTYSAAGKLSLITGSTAVRFDDFGGGTFVPELVVAEATHGHAADAVVLTSQSSLAVADSTHGHAADNITLEPVSGAVTLTVADSTHGHTAEAPALTTDVLLVVADATHGHSADLVVLASEHVLVVADATHAHTADAVVVSTSWLLTVASALHGHAAEAPTLSTDWLLAVADALHAHAADNVVLDTSSAIVLTIQDSAHAHGADGLALTVEASLVVAEALHAHQADGVVLTTVQALTVADATHGHTAGNVVLFFATFTEAELLEILAYIQENLVVPTAAEIAAAVWASASGAMVKKLGTNRFVTDPATGIATLYDDDGTTPLQQWEMYEDAAGTIAYRGRGAELRIPI